jgi:hypothetical protein
MAVGWLILPDGGVLADLVGVDAAVAARRQHRPQVRLVHVARHLLQAQDVALVLHQLPHLPAAESQSTLNRHHNPRLPTLNPKP